MWLLAGLYRRGTRGLALLWFIGLAAVALAQAVSGVSTCACLGALRASPWLLFSFDGTAVVALWNWSPKDSSSRRRLPVVLGLSVLPAAGLIGLAAVPHAQPLFAEIDLGDIVQGGHTRQALQIRNDGGASVEVAAIETSCPCASIRLERKEVPAGQFLAGDVSLDLQSKPQYRGELAIKAKGLTRRGRIAFVLTIRARVRTTSQTDLEAHERGSARHERK